MQAFHNGREAKEFLVSKIVAEAQRENVPLSEIERKMLYFTESGWTLPDMMTVSEEFDREHDQDDYERKIARLITETDKHLRQDFRDEYARWWAAISYLQTEDHYISVMIGIGGLRPPGDRLRLFLAGLGIAAGLLVLAFLNATHNIPIISSVNLRVFVWAVCVCLVIAYVFSPYIIGRGKTDDLTLKLLAKIGGIGRRPR
jgi:hypothetical protein